MINKFIRLLRGEYQNLYGQKFYYYFCKPTIPRWYQKLYPRKVPVPRNVISVKPIKIKTYTGINHTIHPDVILHGNRYVMVINPYPYQDPTYENPCIYISHDGITFSAATRNPLDERDGIKSYLSDPTIICANDTFILYYREYINHDNGHLIKIWRSSSSDLSHWEKPHEIYQGTKEYLSLSIVEKYRDKIFYYVDIVGEKTAMFRCREKGLQLIDHEQVEVLGLPQGMMLWHIDINERNNKLIGLMTLSTNTIGYDPRLYMGISHDGGMFWEITKEVCLFENQGDFFKKIYKASLVQNKTGGDNLYFSAMTDKPKWYTYVLEDFDIEKNL